MTFPLRSQKGPERMRAIVARTTKLTPLKAVATKAIQMAQDERTQAMDLATVISADQALTAKILRLSNSPYYGYARRISTVREAVILLGMRTVRSVAVSSAIIDAFKLPEFVGEFSTDLFWAHSVTVGLVAELVAKETKACRPEDAFTAGVLHDVGKLATMVADPETFAELIEIVSRDGVHFRDAELAVFGLTHAEIGAELVEGWRFPEALVAAIRDHHPAGPLVRLSSLTDVVAAANLACHLGGYDCGFDNTRLPERREALTLPAEVDRALARVPHGMAGVSEKARAFLVNVTSRPPRWYAMPGEATPAAEAAEDQDIKTDRAVA